MSNLELSLPNEAVIPSVDSKVFDDHPTARFAVGMLAKGDKVIDGLEEEFKGYLRLRANVYADQTNMISSDLVQEDGTESDEDDKRSVHFAVIENTAEGPRIVSAMRLIVKDKADGTPLPIETYFPEAFSAPAPAMSTEVSRYICRHEDPKIQEDLKWPLYSSALAYIMSHDLAPTYAVVEEFLEKDLQEKTGVPIRRLADPKFLEEYNADNLPIVIDTAELARIMQEKRPDTVQTMRQSEGKFTYF